MRDLNEVSIVAYLQAKGKSFIKDRKGYWCSSPFSRDSDPSFLVDHNNKWRDFSTGKGGRKSGAVSLAFQLDGNVDVLRTIDNVFICTEKAPPMGEPFNNKIPDKYLNISRDEKQMIVNYAKSRGIISGYEQGVYFTKAGENWIRHLSIVYPHKSDAGIIGAKFRNISGDKKDRFRVRGQLGFYILENKVESFDNKLYLIEGEGNANSLWEYCKLTSRNAVILSTGAVSAIPSKIPDTYKDRDGYLLIDYDGNEEIWQERVKMYNHLNLKAVKLVLPKGEDINSLYVKEQLHLIDNML